MLRFVLSTGLWPARGNQALSIQASELIVQLTRFMFLQRWVIPDNGIMIDHMLIELISDPK